MSNNKNCPILSICIPTYNRANYLEKTLISIVNQKTFKETNDVEIVISDNSTSNETYKTVLGFIKIYGEKISYYKNESNLGDLNMEKVLFYGRGMFLKLNNDTLQHNDGSLDKIIETIHKNESKKNILFFLNKVILKNQNSIICKDLNSFVRNASFYVTWIGAFGIWKEDFIKLKDFSRRADLKLPQVDVMFRLINSKGTVFINNERLFNSLPLSSKGGYDVLDVFLDNYIFLLDEQLNNEKLTKNTFIQEKRKLLLQYIRPALVYTKIWPKLFYFEFKNKYKRIFKYYKEDVLILPIFMVYYCISIPYFFLRAKIKDIFKK